ncbi:MAG TPA: DegV family protein [Candidatus Avichristensenella intestinipullorum]|jgi:DegV family protein with EDD domain|uniref:DegV family protein n=1 Tax=Candidatus Avichristensenella intestinipullorum TaxID=2840693 RepID=A0A9D0YXT4_9FIRM|nr:DegV family protein [Candidatus Avichristensenella intestinipullorum]
MPIRKTAIVTDSACDLENSLLEKYHIKFVPLRLVYQGGEVRDRLEVSAEQVYDMLSREIPKTSLPLPEDVLRVYDELADEGYTDAVHISISSGLSGTYNMVRILASEYKRLNVRVVDSKTLSMQEGLIVLSCARLLEKTQDVEEIAAYAVALREKSLGMFVIRTLEYLRKGGRIGLVEGVLGTMLQIKPVIFVNTDGIYQTIAKARGHVNALDAMLREMARRFSGARVRLAVVHGAAPEEGGKLLARLRGLLNIEEEFLCPVSPVLGVHTGAGLLGVIAMEV